MQSQKGLMGGLMALKKGSDGAVGLGGQAKGSSFTQKAMGDIEGFF